MVKLDKSAFSIAALLATAGLGRRIIQLAPKDAFFSQGDPADSVFYLQKGRAKVTVVSASGKEAILKMFSAGEFFGRRSTCGCRGVASIHSYRSYRLHHAEDLAQRNGPFDA